VTLVFNDTLIVQFYLLIYLFTKSLFSDIESEPFFFSRISDHVLYFLQIREKKHLFHDEYEAYDDGYD